MVFGLLRRALGFGRRASAVRKAAGGLETAVKTGATRATGSPRESTMSRQASTLWFRRMERPRLRERVGSDLELEDARSYAAAAQRFYTLPFSLFPKESVFYEEVEDEYVHKVLGHHEDSIDARFLNIMDEYRRATNDNTRLMFLTYMPMVMIGLLTFILVAVFGLNTVDAAAVTTDLPAWLPKRDILFSVGAALAFTLIAMFVLWLVYGYPYGETQHRNVTGLDIYIGNKFGRINQNYQVAKRKALNVERDKRMGQADELREEAAVWTLTYQWMALRLYFCEVVIRNTMFQIRRNTTLYRFAGVGMSLAIAAGAAAGGAAICGLMGMASEQALICAGALGGAGLVFTVIGYWIVMRGTFAMIAHPLEDNQWSRFHTVNLPKTIADHVGEDKLQIITFRDRNRLES